MMARLKRFFPFLSWLLYPIVIFFGLRLTEPRYVALALLVILLLRQSQQARRLLASLSRLDFLMVIGLVLLAVLTALINSELLLRLYPAAVNLGMLVLFGGSLFRPPSMIERFARLGEPDFPAEAVAYTRRVTQIWCAFFVGNGALAVYTALYSSRENWALYNGCIAYVLMGVLFGGEWLFRRFFLLTRTN